MPWQPKLRKGALPQLTYAGPLPTACQVLPPAGRTLRFQWYAPEMAYPPATCPSHAAEILSRSAAPLVVATVSPVTSRVKVTFHASTGRLIQKSASNEGNPLRGYT